MKNLPPTLLPDITHVFAFHVYLYNAIWAGNSIFRTKSTIFTGRIYSFIPYKESVQILSVVHLFVVVVRDEVLFSRNSWVTSDLTPPPTHFVRGKRIERG